MANEVKKVVGYGILNFILFTIISIIFSNKIEWHSLLTIFIIMLIATLLLYHQKAMAIYIMGLAMVFILVTLIVAVINLITGNLEFSSILLGISWVSIIINVIIFILWSKAAISYRRKAGVYFRQ